MKSSEFDFFKQKLTEYQFNVISEEPTNTTFNILDDTIEAQYIEFDTYNEKPIDYILDYHKFMVAHAADWAFAKSNNWCEILDVTEQNNGTSKIIFRIL